MFCPAESLQIFTTGARYFTLRKASLQRYLNLQLYTEPDKAIKWKKNDHYGLSDIMFPTARKRKKIKKMGISMIYNDYTTSASTYNIIIDLS